MAQTSRRGFLRGLGAGATGTVAALAITPGTVIAINERLGTGRTAPPSEWFTFRHAGFQVRWSGWKGDVESVTLGGQWTAWPITLEVRTCVPGHYQDDAFRIGLYVGVPAGGEGPFAQGEVFDISVRHVGDLVTAETSDADLFLRMQEGRVRLLKLLADVAPHAIVDYEVEEENR